jgi:hypothetical protein
MALPLRKGALIYLMEQDPSEPGIRERNDLANILRIEREARDGEPRPITLPEWAEAVASVDGLRMSQGDASAINPLTKERVVIPNRGGDAELFRDDCNRWMRVLWWSPGGSIHFAEPENKGDPVLTAARSLAHALEARIVADGGLPYE